MGALAKGGPWPCPLGATTPEHVSEEVATAREEGWERPGARQGELHALLTSHDFNHRVVNHRDVVVGRRLERCTRLGHHRRDLEWGTDGRGEQPKYCRSNLRKSDVFGLMGCSRRRVVSLVVSCFYLAAALYQHDTRHMRAPLHHHAVGT